MKLKSYMAAAALGAGLLIANSANAQWTRNAGTLQTYLTNTADFLGIGTTNPLYKVDIRNTGIATMQFKSNTDNANFLLDKGAANKVASVNYRTLGVTNWQTGCVQNSNYTIRNFNTSTVVMHFDYATNYVGIGTIVPAAKLHVVGGAAAGDTLPVIFATTSYAGTATDVTAITADAATSTAAGYGIGVQALGNFIGTFSSGGIFGLIAAGGATGVDASTSGSSDTTVATGFLSHAVDASAGGGYESVGLQAIAGDGQYNYGVIGLCGPNYTPADSDNTHKNWGGYFFGDIVYSRAYKWSDARLKTDIRPIESALEKLGRVQTSTYNYRTSEFAQLDLPAGRQMGFIADNLQTVFPDLVKETRSPSIVTGHGRDRKIVRESVTYKAVNYEGIIPVVVAAINEQSQKSQQNEAQMNARISQLENEIAELKAMLTEKKGNVTETGSLLQNVPNPANGNTTISFYLPENSKGVLQVTDATGKVVKSFNVSGSGMQDVVVNTTALSSGSYTYSLSINGKVADSKTMVINK